jgi:predicted transcriptional regulator
MGYTTIQLSTELLNKLKARKLSDRETYEEVIENLIEDTMELSEETIADIERARAEIKRGEFYTEEEVRKALRL